MDNEFNRGNPFFIKAYTELIDGNGTYLVKLDHYPITTLTSVTVDDNLLTSDDYTEYLKDGYLILESCAKCGHQNVEVVYEAGLFTEGAAIGDRPDYLKEMALLLVEDIMLQKGNSAGSDSDEWSIEDYKTKVSNDSGTKNEYTQLSNMITKRNIEFRKVNCTVL